MHVRPTEVLDMLDPERRSRGLRVLFVMAVGVAAVVAACGGSSSAILSPVGAPVSGTGDVAQPYPAASAAPSQAPAEAPGGQPQAGGTGGGGGTLTSAQDTLRVVYTGSLQLVVDDLATALAKGRAAVLAVGGYIGASKESNDGDRSVATITYRIPASRWEDAMDSLRAVAAKVVAEETQATEVGSQIVDLEARIRNLRASETSLQAIASGTGKVSDLLEVQAQLTEVRGQIEQLDAQRAQLTDQVAYGTLVTTYGLQLVQVQETAKGWDPRTDVDAATATLIGAGQTIASGLIWFGIVWLPVVVVLLVLALVVRAVFRRFGPSGGSPGPIPGWGEGPGGS